MSLLNNILPLACNLIANACHLSLFGILRDSRRAVAAGRSWSEKNRFWFLISIRTIQNATRRNKATGSNLLTSGPVLSVEKLQRAGTEIT